MKCPYGNKWYDKDAAPIDSQYNPGGVFIRDPFGKDCDDTTKGITNQCYNFYYIDNDGDGWDSGMVAEIDDNGGKYKVTSNGTDCDDTVSSADNKCGNDDCKTSKEDLKSMFPSLSDTKATLLAENYKQIF